MDNDLPDKNSFQQDIPDGVEESTPPPVEDLDPSLEDTARIKVRGNQQEKQDDVKEEAEKDHQDDWFTQYPTGAPDLTGGWISEAFNDLEEGELKVDAGIEEGNDLSKGLADENPAIQPVTGLGETMPAASEEKTPEFTQPVQPTGGIEITDSKKTGTPESEGPDYPTIPLEEEIEITPAKPIRSYTPPLVSTRLVPPPPGATRPVLPNRTNVDDTQATQVTPVAYEIPSKRSNRASSIATQPVRTKSSRGRSSHKQTAGSSGRGGFIQAWGCFVRMVLIGLFVIVFGLILVISVGVFQYYRIAQDLPPVENLKERAAKFETTRILDRDGNVIYEILDPNAGRRTYVPLNQISPYLIAATIATEDKEYYNHPGFDPIAVARAFYQNYTAGEIVSGASTITQQLARMLLLDDNERYMRTYERKTREIVLAAEITRKYSKEEILEIFLNENNYGNLAYGIQAASETYFNTSADQLTLGQASFLAGLPQAPAVYDVYTNREGTLIRQKTVLLLMYQLSQEKDCIYVSTSHERVCVNEIARAAQEIEQFVFNPHDYSMVHPHWVNYIRAQLESQFDPQTIYRSGFTVTTTLDPVIQQKIQEIIQNQLANLVENNATNGAAVVIQPSTGEILAMVGSADFYKESISGQVNMALAPRQPGSAIKPLVFLAAFEKGWTPATLIWDVPTEFPPSGDPNDLREPYKPINYDGRFHGPVTVRSALGNSYNIPSVKALEFVGIYDNPQTEHPDGLIEFMKRLGITTLTSEDYGMSLSLGGGETTLLEMTNVFSTIANTGNRIPPVAITKIVDHLGNLVYEYQKPTATRVIREEHAYLISSILSDNQARAPMFGANSVLNLPFEAAVKTGTTNDFRDNLTIGYTPDVAIGVWVGNADYSPMINTTGITGAAPIWAESMQFAVDRLKGGVSTNFVRPAGIVDRVICSVSGSEPSEWCTNQRNELFAYDQGPLPNSEDLWQKIDIDTWTGLRASSACNEFTEEEFVLNVKDKWAIKWIKETEDGKNWARNMGFGDSFLIIPERECKADDPRAKIIFAGIFENQIITESPLDIYALVDATHNYRRMQLDYGEGSDPSSWEMLAEFNRNFSETDVIYTWDLLKDEIKPGEYTLRIRIESTEEGRYAEKKIKIRIQVATPTPTATSTATITPTPTTTPTPTASPLPTETAVPVSPTVTPSPTTLVPTAVVIPPSPTP